MVIYNVNLMISDISPAFKEEKHSAKNNTIFFNKVTSIRTASSKRTGETKQLLTIRI
jgi:hypothetical protein